MYENGYASPWSGQESSNQAQKRSGRNGITWREGIDALEIMMGDGGWNDVRCCTILWPRQIAPGVVSKYQ
jgi:hypothetical protein